MSCRRFRSRFGGAMASGLMTFAFARHSREGGNPATFVRERLKSLDSRLRGNDELCFRGT
ncbi:hypothetical protein [Lysobacter gummosus]|uniref:hypothetical protein n=1 Tax=Lysobacter gummosus TaxID=262324 RepID=UPI0036455A68